MSSSLQTEPNETNQALILTSKKLQTPAAQQTHNNLVCSQEAG